MEKKDKVKLSRDIQTVSDLKLEDLEQGIIETNKEKGNYIEFIKIYRRILWFHNCIKENRTQEESERAFKI